MAADEEGEIAAKMRQKPKPDMFQPQILIGGGRWFDIALPGAGTLRGVRLWQDHVAAALADRRPEAQRNI